jgi:iron-sulfur cluster repair protein YtfE (RIC family)
MDEMLNHLKKEEEILFPLMLEIDRAYSEKIKL